MSVVGKYMETFVREAIARAAYERQEELENRREKGEKIRPGEGFLDVGVLSFRLNYYKDLKRDERIGHGVQRGCD